jgi:hypothetical protein
MTVRKHALLGGAVHAVVADLDHPHPDVGGAPGLVDVRLELTDQIDVPA